MKIMDKDKSYKSCEHTKVKQTGLWDGPDNGGPIAECELCDKEINFTWEEWDRIPKENKTEL